MLRLIGSIFVLLTLHSTADARKAQSKVWLYSALSMANIKGFGGAFGNVSQQTAERLATERCQRGSAGQSCFTVSVKYREGSPSIPWLAGMRCGGDRFILVKGQSRDDAIEVMWNEAYHSGFDPKIDCDLKAENMHLHPADDIFD